MEDDLCEYETVEYRVSAHDEWRRTYVNTNDNNEADDYPGLDLEEEESKHSVSLCVGGLCS